MKVPGRGYVGLRVSGMGQRNAWHRSFGELVCELIIRFQL